MSDKPGYLYATARIRALELSLVNTDRIERLLAAKTNEELIPILNECGYVNVQLASIYDIEHTILSQRLSTYELVDKLVEDKNITDVLRIKYDYHNIKVIIKSQDTTDSNLFIESGRLAPQSLEVIIRESDYFKLNTVMSKAIIAAREVLSRTGNPQYSDFLLDSACFKEMQDTAEKTKSKFIKDYVKLLIDINNLRSFIRCYKMQKGSDLLKNALFEGGDIDTAKLISSIDDANFKAEIIYAMTHLENAATIGDFALNTQQSLTFFEKTCDNVIMEYLKSAKYISFGEQPVFAYLAVKEAEFMTIRTILTGKLAKVNSDTIRERLRSTYV